MVAGGLVPNRTYTKSVVTWRSKVDLIVTPAVLSMLKRSSLCDRVRVLREQA